MKIITQNKRASFDYFLSDTYEAGIKLTGTEVKSIRLGKTNINDSYVIIRNERVYIINMFIAKYEMGNIFNHDERRERELLLHKKEIHKIMGRCKQDGYTLIPTKVYMKDALVKISFSLGKGKKLYDKRDDMRKRDLDMEARRASKNRF